MSLTVTFADLPTQRYKCPRGSAERQWIICSDKTGFGMRGEHLRLVCSLSLGSLLLIDGLSAVSVVVAALCVGYHCRFSERHHSQSGGPFGKIRPLLGTLYQPFRDHHHDPQAITKESFVALCVPAMFTATPPLVLGLVKPVMGWVLRRWFTLLWVVPMGGSSLHYTPTSARGCRSPLILKLQNWD